LISSSSPTVRRTRFKSNASCGVRINSGCIPDFGVAADSGINSFVNVLAAPSYKDLNNALNPDVVYAIGNWWGENPPDTSQILGAVYKPYLSSDPLPARIAPEVIPDLLPEDFSVATVYPNPFNPSAVVKFNLSTSQNVAVRIYNILGQEVRLLVDGPMPAGQHTVIWDGRNAGGEPVSSGVYLCKLSTAERQRTLKMTILR
jgi:hypothetical protein